ESGVDPDKVLVTQFGTTQILEMARDPTIDAFMAVGPLGSKITADAIAATAPAKVETVSVNHLIVARKSLSETAVGTFVRQLFAVRQQLAREVPGAAKIEKP